MQNKNKKLSFRLSEELRAKLLSYSKEKQISVSSLIEKAILDHFSHIEKKKSITLKVEHQEVNDESVGFHYPKFWVWFISIGIVSAIMTFVIRISKKRGL